MNPAANRLIIFLRAPLAGTVKTRLAARIGPAAALAAYRALLTTLLDRLAPLRGVELRFTPDTALPQLQPWLRPHWSAQPQGAGGLGKRLQRAFEQAFASGARRVAVIGSDCPAVTPADIRAAWRALSRHEVALGPARDGGYWLIALRRPAAALFERIPWSTARVRAATLARARAAGLSVRLLRELADVDTAADWAAFCSRAAGARMPLGRRAA